jgi:hypothetical protein
VTSGDSGSKLVMKGPWFESGRRLLKVLQKGYFCLPIRRRIKCSKMGLVSRSEPFRCTCSPLARNRRSRRGPPRRPRHPQSKRRHVRRGEPGDRNPLHRLEENTDRGQVLNEGVPSFPKFGEDDRRRGAAGERFQILGAGIYGPPSVLSFSGRTRPARAVSPHLQRSRPAATSRLPSPSLRSSRGATGCHPKLRR